jgi:hypothetical protein
LEQAYDNNPVLAAEAGLSGGGHRSGETPPDWRPRHGPGARCSTNYFVSLKINSTFVRTRTGGDAASYPT